MYIRSLNQPLQFPPYTGGGVAGCSALYHLAKRGVRAVLLERSKLTSGTTWHTAGITWSLRPCETEIGLLRRTRECLAELERETGENAGWTNNGGLFIAHNNTRMDEYRRLVDMGKVFGLGAKILTATEAQELFPLLDPKSFHGAIYSPNDGVIDPAMMVAALTKCSKSRGAQVIFYFSFLSGLGISFLYAKTPQREKKILVYLKRYFVF